MAPSPLERGALAILGLKMEKNTETLLAELYAEIRKLNVGPMPRFLSLKRAARELDISVKKLKVMIEAGQIAYQTFESRKSIPRREIERLEREAKPKARPGPKPKKVSAPVERGALREYLRSI